MYMWSTRCELRLKNLLGSYNNSGQMRKKDRTTLVETLNESAIFEATKNFDFNLSPSKSHLQVNRRYTLRVFGVFNRFVFF